MAYQGGAKSLTFPVFQYQRYKYVYYKKDIKSRNQKRNTWSRYVKKLFINIHPFQSLSNQTLEILDDFINDFIKKLATEAGELAHYVKRKTLTEKDLEAAVKLLVRGELARFAIIAANRAMENYKQNTNDGGLAVQKYLSFKAGVNHQTVSSFLWQ